MTVHEVTFQRHRDALQAPQIGLVKPTQYRAMCSCGWFGQGANLTELQLRASVHADEWQDIKPEAKDEATDNPK